MRWCALGLLLAAIGSMAVIACSSSEAGAKREGACASFCQAFASGNDCSGVKTQCSNECDSAVNHCPTRANAMLGCLAGLDYSCTSPGEAHASGSTGSAGSPATLVSGGGTLYVDDAYCAQLVQEYNDCTPVGSGGTGGVEVDSGSGGSPSGGYAGTGAGGAGGSGGGGQPDLADVDFAFTVTSENKDPSGEGGPAVPYEVTICIEPAQSNFVQVTNVGTGTAGPFKMGIQLMKGANVVDGCEDLVESDPLAPTYQTSWTNQYCCVLSDTISTFDFNPRTIRVVADVGNEVSESNESNNQKMTPEFEVTSL